MRFRSLFLLVPILALTACAAHGVRHVATVSVTAAHASLLAVQATADLLVCGKPTAPAAPQCLSAEDRAHKVAPLLSKAFDYDVKAALIVRDIPEGAPPPGDLAPYLAKVGALIDEVLALLPNSQPKAALVASIGGK